MKTAQRLTAIIEREDDGFVALCPELDVASEGASIEEARVNLIEALTLFSRRRRLPRLPIAFITKFLSLKSRRRLGRLRVLSGSATSSQHLPAPFNPFDHSSRNASIGCRRDACRAGA